MVFVVIIRSPDNCPRDPISEAIGTILIDRFCDFLHYKHSRNSCHGKDDRRFKKALGTVIIVTLPWHRREHISWTVNSLKGLVINYEIIAALKV